MKEKNNKPNYDNVHWADNFAQRAIDATPNAKEYVVESGVTPSGIIHVGHFREVITMEMIRRGFENKGKKTRFLYSWDSYDAFRKVPGNIPQEFEQYLRLPLNQVPDPFGDCHNSFAEHFMSEGEEALKIFNFPIEFQYQHELQVSGIYAQGIRTILKAEQEGKIQEILNKSRQEPLKKDWTSATLFCEECSKDTTKVTNYDGEYTLDYECECGYKNTVNFKTNPIVKLLFRTDWPMRWNYYGVNVEGGGKDYSTPGSPWFTGNEILQEIFNKPSLIGPFHNFIGMKGTNGKISSSKGNGATTSDLLKIYTPELVLFLFAGTRPNAEFDISFDLDVIKIYEDFDKLERLYYGLENEKNPKKLATRKRIYELSMEENKKPQKEMPFQPSFRHLLNIIQSNNFDFEKTKNYYKDSIKTDFDLKRLKERNECAQNWLEIYAPEDMKFNFNENLNEIELTNNDKKIIKSVSEVLVNINNPKELFGEFKKISQENEIEVSDFFKLMYKVIINKEKGPKLGGFMIENKDTVLNLLNQI